MNSALHINDPSPSHHTHKPVWDKIDKPFIKLPVPIIKRICTDVSALTVEQGFSRPIETRYAWNPTTTDIFDIAFDSLNMRLRLYNNRYGVSIATLWAAYKVSAHYEILYSAAPGHLGKSLLYIQTVPGSYFDSNASVTQSSIDKLRLAVWKKGLPLYPFMDTNVSLSFPFPSMFSAVSHNEINWLSGRLRLVVQNPILTNSVRKEITVLVRESFTFEPLAPTQQY